MQLIPSLPAADGQAEAVEKLVDLGCDLSHADNEGNTAWHAAAQSSSVAVLRKLLDYGCPLSATNNLKCTALHYAARSGEETGAESARGGLKAGVGWRRSNSGTREFGLI